MAGIHRVISTSVTHRAIRMIPYALSPRGKAPFQLALLEVGLGFPFLLAHLYTLGKAKAQGSPYPRSRLLTAFAEAGITSGLTQSTKGVYPLLGMAWGAYEMGVAKSKTERMKAALKAAILFPLGYLGVNMGLSYTDGMYYRDAKNVFIRMKELGELLGAQSQSAQQRVYQELKPILGQLKEESSNLVKIFEHGTPKAVKIKELTSAFDLTQSALAGKLSSLPKKELLCLQPGTRRALQTLASEIGSSQGYGILRALNPLFGYLLAVTIIGIPVVKMAAKSLIPPSPDAPSTDSWHDVADPLWLNRLWKPASQTDILAHSMPFLNADGPTLIGQGLGAGSGSGH